MKSLADRNVRSASCQLSNLLIKVVDCIFKLMCYITEKFDSNSQNQVGVVQPGTGQQVPVTDSIRRHEVDTVLANQREIVGAAREIK